jgi:Ni/Co efflux regulator RcnB
MKSTAIVCAIACASLGFSALSFAQGYDRRGARHEQPPQAQQQGPRHAQQRDQPRYEHRMDRRAERQDERHFDHRQDSGYDQRDARQNDRPGYYYNARGPEFRRGGYIPREFRNRQYVVNDYRMYRLSPPPRGHQWVQVGADYVLIVIATGLIAHIVLSH